MSAPTHKSADPQGAAVALEPSTRAVDGAPPESATPATPTQLAGSALLALADPARQATMVLALQRSCGNRGVQRFFGETGGETGTETGSAGEEHAPEPVAGATSSRAQEIATLRRVNFEGLSDAEKLAVAADILDLGLGTGLDEGPATLRALWDSFGTRLAEVAAAHFVLWERCVDYFYVHGLEDLAQIEALKKRFGWDVVHVARGYLSHNHDVIEAEIERVYGDTGTGADAKDREAAQEAAFAEIRDAGDLVIRFQRQREALRDELIGWGWLSMGGEQQEGEEEDLGESDPIYFDPAMPPSAARREYNAIDLAGYRAWDAINEEDQGLKSSISNLLSAHPSLFALLRDEQLEAFLAGAGSGNSFLVSVAKAGLSTGLRSLLADIDAAWEALEGAPPTLNPLDLLPIHDQLFKGEKESTSGLPWTEPLYQWVGKTAVDQHESTEFWTSLGLSAVGAAAFLFAEFVSVGMATAVFAGIGASVTGFQVVDAYDQWAEAQLIERTRTTDHDRLMYEHQVASKKFGFGVEAVLAPFDLLPAAGKLLRGLLGAPAATAAEAGVRAGSEAAGRATEQLVGLTRNTPGAAAMVAEAIDVMGVAKVLQVSKKTPDELAAIVGEASPLAARIHSAALGSLDSVASSLDDALAQLYKGGGGTRAFEIDMYILDAIERFGPLPVLARAGGWRKLVSALGDDSLASGQLLHFRDVVLKKEIDDFAMTLPRAPEQGEVLVRTGTVGQASNDFDIDLLGPYSAQNRAKLRQFLAARLDVGPDELGPLLHADFFTDPTRLHLFDYFPPEIRKEVAQEEARFEEELIMNRALHEAIDRGDEALQDVLRKRMAARNIDEVYEPLDPEVLEGLHADIDDWHLALAEASEPAEQVRLAKQIARAQGQINAVEKGGYLTGGGAKMFVTDPEQIAAKLGFENVPVAPAHQFGAALDQVVKLYPDIQKIFTALDDGDLSALVKEMSKYLDRFAEVTRDVMHAETIAALRAPVGDLEALTHRFLELSDLSRTAKDLLAQARGEASETLLSRIQREKAAVVAEARQAADQFFEAQWPALDLLSARIGMEGKLGNVSLLAQGQELLRNQVRLRRLEETLKEHLRALLILGPNAAKEILKAVEGDRPRE